MKILQAVVLELVQFVFVDYFGFRKTTQTIDFSPQKQLYSESPVQEPAGEKMYINTAEALLFHSPVILFDGVLQRVPYATPVYLQNKQNRWAQVSVGNNTGWILRDVLCTTLKPVVFEVNKSYPLDSTETLTVRAAINDEFSGAMLGVPLQDVEYVYYRLYLLNKKIEWDNERPRLAGRWHQILKGNSVVHIDIQPTENSLIEYADDDGIGHLAFVDLVLPDKSLVVSTIDNRFGGKYITTRLYHDQWQELQPVFLQIGE